LYATGSRCAHCGEMFPIGALEECTACGGILDVGYDYDRMFAEVDIEAVLRRKEGVWGFRELLPAKEGGGSLSMGEGDTPLLFASRLGEAYGIDNLHIKDDSQNPTGSFKDRPMTVSVAMARAPLPARTPPEPSFSALSACLRAPPWGRWARWWLTVPGC